MALTRATDKIIANADGNLNLSGIVTATFAPSGDLNVGSNIKLGTASGIVTATKFVGDISDATGASAGLGTALSQDKTSPLNTLYYVNTVMSINSTVTVDPPPTALAVYTNYAELQIEDSADLIIESGDVIPNVFNINIDQY